jgi:hypothetical protein
MAQETEGTMSKELKTKTELESIIMYRVRTNADRRPDKSAIVTPLQRAAAHLPNWDAAFVVDGADLPPAEIHYLVSAFQNQYDLKDA